MQQMAASGGMQMGGPPGGGPPGSGGQGNAAAAESGGGALSALLKFMPENLTLATGFDVKGVLADKSNQSGRKLIQEFEPIFAILAKGGIKPSQIEYLWAGCNRDSGDMMICVRTSGSTDNFIKKLGASTAEKVGKSKINILSTGPEKNAVAAPDGKTLLLGRVETLKAALSAPKSGGVRGGVEGMNQSDAFYWIAGDAAAAKKRLAGSDIPLLEDYASEGARMSGYALGFGGKPVARSGQGGGNPFGGPGMGGPPGGMPGGGMPGMPGMPGSGGQQAGKSKRIDAVLAMVFQSEGLADTANNRLQELIKKHSPRQQGGMPGMPGGMGGPGPGGAQPGGAGPGAPGDFRGLLRYQPDEEDSKESQVVVFRQAPPGGGGPPSGPPGGMPGGPGGGMPGMPGMPGGAGSQDEERLIRVTVAVESVNIRLGLSIPQRPDLGVVFVEKALNDAIQAMGAVAMSDGLFDGSLAEMRVAYDKIVAAKPTGIKGLKRAGDDLPLWAGYSWMTELLPYIGYNDLYLQFDQEKPWIDETNRVHAYVVIPAFVNPADPNVQWNGHPYDGAGLTHFAGMAGVEDRRSVVAAELPRTDPRAGIFGYDEIARLEDVTDGKAQTIMLIGTGKASAPWIQGGGGTVRGARQPYFDEFHGFGSYGLPKKGVYVMMADGSARVINADIDPQVFKALCTMHGAEVIDMQNIAANAP